MTTRDSDGLVKTATVRLAPAEAFDLFTKSMGEWWPLATHSVGLEHATGVEVEPGVGGNIIETIADGSTSIWGTINVWEPSRRLRFSWHPGGAPANATEVDVLFHQTDSGTTVELIHTGWDRRPDGAAARAQYDPGWDLVFGLYAEAGAGRLTP